MSERWELFLYGLALGFAPFVPLLLCLWGALFFESKR